MKAFYVKLKTSRDDTGNTIANKFRAIGLTTDTEYLVLDIIYSNNGNVRLLLVNDRGEMLDRDIKDFVFSRLLDEINMEIEEGFPIEQED